MYRQTVHGKNLWEPDSTLGTWRGDPVKILEAKKPMVSVWPWERPFNRNHKGLLVLRRLMKEYCRGLARAGGLIKCYAVDVLLPATSG